MSRVFVSYSHDTPEHRTAIHRLCDALRALNFEVVSDGYTGPPGEGWFDWSYKEIEAASHVLVVCTETYQRRFDNTEKDGVGYGVSWEARAIRQHLVRARGVSNKIIPVLLDDAQPAVIPDVLRDLPYARVVKGNVRDLAATIRRLPQWLPKPLASNWLGALALTLPGIVGVDRFEQWAKTTLQARPCRDDETVDVYAEAILLVAHESGLLDEPLWDQLMARYADHAEELRRIFEQWALGPRPKTVVTIVPSTVPSTDDDGDRRDPEDEEPQGEATHTAVVLDRTDAWRTITTTCRKAKESLAFIVYGTRQQDLHLFLQRIESFLHDPNECKPYHVVKRVRGRSDLSKVVTSGDWERATIDATRTRRPPLEVALADLATAHPVMLLLGGIQPLRDLDAARRAGLIDFVTQVLRTALAAARLAHPIHVLMPIEIGSQHATDLVDGLRDAFEGPSPGLRLCSPIRLVLPDWSEIRAHVKVEYDRYGLKPSDSDYAAIRRLFDGKNPGGASLRELGDALHSQLIDLIEAAKQR